jgi:hypothetical protein
MNLRSVFTLGVVGLAGLGSTASAQSPDSDRIRVRVVERIDTRVAARGIAVQAQNDDPCRDGSWSDDQERVCEVREQTLAAGPLTVEAGQNGGIRVEGTDRSDVHVLAVVTAHARTESEAKQIASGIQVLIGGGRVSSSGPATTGRHEGWSVSYRIQVPRATNLDLNANNGGISIRGVNGTIRFDTTNGGVRLANLAGDVRGGTRNGGLTVELDGNRWDGAGLDVETTNGGVTLAIPDGYNADLTTSTSNGGFRTDFPITVQGELSPRRGLSTTLGSGGPPVRVRTTNGGLRINRR